MKAALSSELIKSHFLGGMIDEELAPEISVFFNHPMVDLVNELPSKAITPAMPTIKDCRPNPNVER